MVAEFTPKFSAVPSLPPQNTDAEESLLGAILMDSQAIGVVAERLKPDTFFISAHAQIYQAALAIHSQGGVVDLMSVTTWLYDHKQLEKVGGQYRLADLVDRTVSSINVDRYADLIIDKYLRRKLITAGNEIIQFGYESFRRLPEIFTEAKERIAALIDSPLLTGEDPERVAYNRLILEIQQIELGCADPGERLWKLQELAKQSGRSTKQLEALYFMSLLKEENESLLTWKELSDRYGDQVREWFLHGFLPKGVVVALHAKGGVGKTRLVYDLLHTLLTGGSWNGFPTTGARRAIVIQTDESAGDMLDALRRRGFDESMDNVRYKTRWTFEHLPQLVKECEEFKPEVIVMDSITSMSRHSLFSENDVEYARPILKLKDLAQMLGCSIILIHHSSKAGDARGTSAIFNSVSEVWKLERDLEDKSPDSTKRLLTLEKSRSRRPTTYKLDFEPDQGSWSLLGEVGVDENNPDLSTKERIVQFLLKNWGGRFEAEEIAHEVDGALPRVRLCCGRLATDGVISQVKGQRGRGKAAQYFIGTENDRPPSNKMIAPPQENDRGGLQILGNTTLIGGGDHFNSLTESGFEPQNDHPIIKNTPENSLRGGQKNDRPIILELEPSHSNENKMIALNDRLNDRPPQGDHFTGGSDQEQGWTKKLFSAIKAETTEKDDVKYAPDPPFDIGEKFVRWGNELRVERVGRDTLYCHLVNGTKEQNTSYVRVPFDEAKKIKEVSSEPVKLQSPETLQRRFPATFVEYEEPPAPFNEGDLVWFDDPDDKLPGNYRVQNCSHTHARLQGLPELVNVAWLVLVEAGSPSDTDFEPAKPNSELTDEDLEDMAESGFDFIPTTEPYDKANPPKQGDRVRQFCGCEKSGQIIRVASRKFLIHWDGGVEAEYTMKDVQTLDIRKEV
ncbi:AAA family ATPase [Microcoleus sp. ZQ-A2]|nr:AAA family ATPase [Microcoleus sp. FACHB-1]